MPLQLSVYYSNNNIGKFIEFRDANNCFELARVSTHAERDLLMLRSQAISPAEVLSYY